jgi:ArsR family transcriptional regulator
MADTLIPKKQLEDAARRFKVLSEPVRLELLNQLQQNGEMTVGELVDATDHQQANVSKHLGMMAREGLLARRKEGLYVHYKISDPTLSALCMLVCNRLRDEAGG